jgi:hypothetical protein
MRASREASVDDLAVDAHEPPHVAGIGPVVVADPQATCDVPTVRHT